MNSFDVLFDIQCLDAGLPPLSRSRSEIVNMIIKASKEDRRRMSRKIRKLTKAVLKNNVNEWESFENEAALRHFGLFGEQKTFCIKILERRITLIKKHMFKPAAEHAHF